MGHDVFSPEKYVELVLQTFAIGSFKGLCSLYDPNDFKHAQ